MDTNINYAAVGAFILILLTAIVLGIIWLSSGFSFQSYTNYVVYMTESVTGLSIDSPVEFNGVGVGNVKGISLDVNNPQRVEVLLNIISSTPVTEGTVATLNSRGLTSMTYVALKDIGKNQRPLKALPGQRYPVIKTAPSIFMRLDIALKEVSENFRQVSQTIQNVFDKENQDSLKHTLSNLERITRSLAANDLRMTQILENTQRASLQLRPLMQSGINTMNMLQVQTLPATYRILVNLEEITQNFAQISQEIKQNPSILIRGMSPSPLGPGEKR